MSESKPKVTVEQADGVARIWLDRPDVHNAFDDELIRALQERLAAASHDDDVRVIVLGGRGKSFSAGADLSWMKRSAVWTDEENARDARGLAGLFRELRNSPKVTVARVHGTAMGGGLGLIAACDLAFALQSVKFSFSEVKLGLIPAVISPHVIDKIGPARARELFLTAARFDAARAAQMGLISAALPDEAALDAAVEEAIGQVRAAGPHAVAAAKALVRQVTALPVGEVDAYTAAQIAARRASAEGQEGLRAFLEKRPPRWAPDAD